MKSCSLLSVLVIVFGVQASITFYGYKEKNLNDTLKQYVLTELGNTELEISEITAVPMGSYLDITEDAWLSSDVNKMNIAGLTGDYLMKGTIPVPDEATVVGLETWKGDTLYRAGLYESKYIVDNSFPDSMMLQHSLDSRIALLQKHTDYNYELTMTRIALGERKHVRIRYLLRMTRKNLGEYTIPVLLHNMYGESPKNIKYKMYADNRNRKYILHAGSMKVLLSDTSTNLIPYQPTFTLMYNSPSASTVNITEFNSWPYKGNYLLCNTAINDSIVTKLSKPISTVFVWHWNSSSGMIEFQNQVKTLSAYAKGIIQKAREIRNTMTELKKLGNHICLIHTIDGQSAVEFSSTVFSNTQDSSVLAYLESFNEKAMYEKYVNKNGALPSWVPKESNSSVIEQSRNALFSVLSNAVSLLQGDTSKNYKHIIMLSEGYTPSENRMNFSNEYSKLLSSITVDAQSFGWRGVDIDQSFKRDNLYFWRNFRFPAFSPVLIQLRIKNMQQPFSFQLEQNVWKTPLTISARTFAAWDTSIYWTGFDGAGIQTAIIKEQPIVFLQYADSGLAKIWANDENHIADDEEIYPGGTFGILTKATYFQATVNSISENDSKTVPYLSDEEIFAPRSSCFKVNKVSYKPKIEFYNGILHINTENEFNVLKIYNLQGKLIVIIDLKKYKKSGTGYHIPMSSLFSRIGNQKLLVKLTGKNTAETFSLFIGGFK